MTRFGNVLVIVLFGFLYSWDLWEAVGNLVGLGPFYDALGIAGSMPWGLLWVGVAVPVIVFGGALWWGRKRPLVTEKALVLLMGWAVVAAVSMSLASVEQAWRASALQGLVG